MRNFYGLLRKNMPAIFGIAVIFLLVLTASTSDINSDMRYELLVSQSILQNGTIKLDSYINEIELRDSIKLKNGHLYYFFPLGTSLFSMPFVWAANLFGKDMLHYRHEYEVQIALAAALCSLSFLFIYITLTGYIRRAAGFIIASVTFLGSPLISTMGTALWSHDFTVFFIALCLMIIAMKETGKIKSLNPFLLGFLAFSAYLSRPTASVFALSMFIYLFLKDKKAFIKALASFSLFFAGLAAFSLYEFGEVLPDYYMPGRLYSGTFFIALYGNLLSPSRGLFVFSPFLAVVLAGAVYLSRELKGNRLFWCGLLWFILNLTAVSQFPHWWAGWSFGPRLQTDVMPAFALMTALIWHAIENSRKRPAIIRLFASAYLFLAFIGVFINTAQGLYNRNTFFWNQLPPLEDNPKYIFDWRYPQFLATNKNLTRKVKEHFGGNVEVSIDYKNMVVNIVKTPAMKQNNAEKPAP